MPRYVAEGWKDGGKTCWKQMAGPRVKKCGEIATMGGMKSVRLGKEEKVPGKFNTDPERALSNKLLKFGEERER